MDDSSADIPLGISALEGVERVWVRGGGGGAKYVVVAGGRELLTAREHGPVLAQVLGGRNRAFQIDVFDAHDREVMRLRRPYSVGADKLEVSVGGSPAAVVRREPTFLKPVLTIRDAADRLLLRVKGPASTSGLCDFELYSPEKQRVGEIGKRWSGAARPADHDSFALRFPPDLDVRAKAAVIATCFLIDFLIFDN